MLSFYFTLMQHPNSAQANHVIFDNKVNITNNFLCFSYIIEAIYHKQSFSLQKTDDLLITIPYLDLLNDKEPKGIATCKVHIFGRGNKNKKDEALRFLIKFVGTNLIYILNFTVV